MPAPNTNACFTRGTYADTLAVQTEVATTTQAAFRFRSQVTSPTMPATAATADSV